MYEASSETKNATAPLMSLGLANLQVKVKKAVANFTTYKKDFKSPHYKLYAFQITVKNKSVFNRRAFSILPNI